MILFVSIPLASQQWNLVTSTTLSKLHFPLPVFRSLIPVSFTVVMVACLACVIVTLIVANLELGDEEMTPMSVSTIVTPSQPSSIGAGSGNTPGLKMNRKTSHSTQNRLSAVAGPALRTLSSYDAPK